MAVDSYDAIVIGAGHNGLIAAAYLARAGWRVLVLERRDVVGGCCVTEEVFPGFRVSTAAYVCSLLRPEIIRDLKLAEYGYELLLRDPSSFSPFPDNRHLLFWKDPKLLYGEIAKFSEKDARRYEAYEKHLEVVVGRLEPMLMAPPPDPTSRRWRDLWAMGKLALSLRGSTIDLVRLFSMSAADYLDRWFESDQLKVRLVTDGIIGAMAGPRTPGTAYVLFHHVMGQSDGQRGVWGYVRGGMGTITRALAEYVRARKGVIETSAEVARVLVKGQRCVGVALSDGREFRTRVTLSNADPKRTFLGMFDPLDLPESLVEEVRGLRFDSATCKINVAASGVPDFRAYPGSQAGPQHRGTIHLCPSIEYLERAYDEAKWGSPSSRPFIEMCIPSVIDETIAPPGKHFFSLFVQYAPYHRRDGQGWNETTEKQFAESVFDVFREYTTNWDDIVEDYQVLSPKGLEDRFGLTSGNIFHGAMTLDQLFFMRPVPSCARYRTPIEGFYLCGSGCHPGGGVLGAPGFLAAHRVLREQSK
jgi:phytoene dehydrogenase-like protein